MVTLFHVFCYPTDILLDYAAIRNTGIDWIKSWTRAAFNEENFILRNERQFTIPTN